MTASEFPLLEGLGLYASDIAGDGNCLFNSFSDQLCGHQKEASAIRQRTVQHMRDNADYFKLFLDVDSVRPQKKRAAAAIAPPPTEAAVDRAFENHVKRMEKSGVYGDNMEIVAFARAYNVDVKIYQRDFAYQICGADDTLSRQLLHIAYHSWEHYSSIRNVNGPHSGVPNVTPVPTQSSSAQSNLNLKNKHTYVLPWMESVVLKSLPHIPDAELVRKTLEDCKGNVNEAVSRLLDTEQEGLLTPPDTPKEVSEIDEPQIEDVSSITVEPPLKKAKFNGTKTSTEVDGSTTATSIGRTATTLGPKSKRKDESLNSISITRVRIGASNKSDIGDTTSNRPNRETARDRKERQKREATERKKNKTNGLKKDNNPAKDDVASEGQLTHGMKVLHV